jgi:NAD(P)-dependent dehydrogenase (short-subunit alcohol dehydrogenase family)
MTETAHRTQHHPRPVALVANAHFYVGPELARHLAARGFDLVLGEAARPLVDELEAAGSAVHVVDGVRDLSSADSHRRLVDGAMTTFGRLDSAVMFSGDIVTGRFVNSTIDDLHAVVRGCLEAPYHFMKTVVPSMIESGQGQVLVITSASAARPTPGAPLYSAARAGASMLVRNVADEIARTGVQVNAVGTNFMDFPAFLKASGATDPEVRAKIESQVPMRRLGTMEEFAAFCMAFLDGSSRFTTGQFVAYAGGWA